MASIVSGGIRPRALKGPHSFSEAREAERPQPPDGPADEFRASSPSTFSIASRRQTPFLRRIGASIGLAVALGMTGSAFAGSIAAAAEPRPAAVAIAAPATPAPFAWPRWMQYPGTSEGVFDVSAKATLQDSVYVHAGSVLYLEDIQHRIHQLTEALAQGSDAGADQKKLNAVALLASAKRRYPQAVKFQVVERNGRLRVQPLDWQNEVTVRVKRSPTSTVIGGELESIVTAMRLANRGQHVALVYAAPLGGLNAEEGANMRYFDCVQSVRYSPEQAQIFSQAFHSRDCNVIPDHADALLANFLKQHYPAIELIPTRTLNGLHVEVAESHMRSVTTEEGVQLTSRTFFGTDADGVLAEKAGLPVETEHLIDMSDGVVFDLLNLRASDLDRLARPITAQDLLHAAGVSVDEFQQALRQTPSLRTAYARFTTQSNVEARPGKQSLYGYSRLGTGFDLYCRLLALHQPSLNAVNAMREINGFNIAIHPQADGSVSATFNSVSYHFAKSHHQGDHDLAKDAEFAPVRADMQRMQAYMRAMADNPRLIVRMPRQLYVRRPERIFETAHMRGLEQILVPQSGSTFKFAYMNDGRGTDAVNATSTRYFAIDDVLGGPIKADVTAAQAETSVDNLYVLGKSVGFQAEATPWARIQQQMMDVGVTVAQDVATHRAIPPLVGSVAQLTGRYAALKPLLAAARAERDYGPPTAGMAPQDAQALRQFLQRAESQAVTRVP